ncbi:MAG: 30S ribosome-binding factor RbfA [Deltaproteobacteria bacterium]|jgi:ribosome-binding factor A|nr:30S ribosome-binding factor RbfA [Deltaproteobacteria bacterium]
MTRKRQEQLGSMVEAFTARLFLTRAADPRLRLVNVTRSRVSADLKSAAVFYSILGEAGDAPPKEIRGALDKAAGFVRSSMAKELSLKTAPKLRFVYDRNPGHAQRIQDLLKSVGASGGNPADDGDVAEAAAAKERGFAAEVPAAVLRGRGDGEDGAGDD